MTARGEYPRHAERIRQELAAAPDGANASKRLVSYLKDAIPHYTWVGIYWLEGNELVLGPYVGKPSPHTRIPLGRGINHLIRSRDRTPITKMIGDDLSQ